MQVMTPKAVTLGSDVYDIPEPESAADSEAADEAESDIIIKL